MNESQERRAGREYIERLFAQGKEIRRPELIAPVSVGVMLPVMSDLLHSLPGQQRAKLAQRARAYLRSRLTSGAIPSAFEETALDLIDLVFDWADVPPTV